jgi:hypothetical protein
MIYKLRVILDAEEDIFRDIAIEDSSNLEDLHNAIYNAFGFDGSEVGSFYTCDDHWEQEEEIPLLDNGDVPGEMKIMADFLLEDVLHESQTKMIYVYDFLSMWTFFVELASIEEEKEDGLVYPALLFAHGVLPDQAPEKEFESDDHSPFDDFEDDLDEDDLDAFGNSDNFEDFGFEENWN